MLKSNTESEAMEEIYVNMEPVGQTASNHTAHNMTADFSDIGNMLTEQNSKFLSMNSNFTETAPRAEETLRTDKHQLFLLIQGLQKKRRADPVVMDD